MRISLRLAVGAVACALSTMAYADSCDEWTHKAYPVSMEACSYSSGGSGYYKITNHGNREARVCWTVVSNNGRENNGCNSNLGAGDSTTGSCFDCGSKNGGVKYILLRSYQVR